MIDTRRSPLLLHICFVFQLLCVVFLAHRHLNGTFHRQRSTTTAMTIKCEQTRSSSISKAQVVACRMRGLPNVYGDSAMWHHSDARSKCAGLQIVLAMRLTLNVCSAVFGWSAKWCEVVECSRGHLTIQRFRTDKAQLRKECENEWNDRFASFLKYFTFNVPLIALVCCLASARARNCRGNSITERRIFIWEWIVNANSLIGKRGVDDGEEK